MNNTTPNDKDRERINLRLEQGTFARIDRVRESRAGVISRNTWISEAIEEKLAREFVKSGQKEQKHARVL
jgi:metal-responsive CopG/Arc/MetJ family transcriptional regulator